MLSKSASIMWSFSLAKRISGSLWPFQHFHEFLLSFFSVKNYTVPSFWSKLSHQPFGKKTINWKVMNKQKFMFIALHKQQMKYFSSEADYIQDNSVLESMQVFSFLWFNNFNFNNWNLNFEEEKAVNTVLRMTTSILLLSFIFHVCRKILSKVAPRISFWKDWGNTQERFTKELFYW